MKTTLAGIHICDLERIEFDTHVHMTKDGEEYGWFDDEEDILVEGMICGTRNGITVLTVKLYHRNVESFSIYIKI